MMLKTHLASCPMRWHGVGDKCPWCVSKRQQIHDRIVLAVVVGLALCSLWALYGAEVAR